MSADRPTGLNGDGSQYTAEEVEWLKAIERYRRDHHRRFLTWCEVLGILLGLGYRKVAGHDTKADG